MIADSEGRYLDNITVESVIKFLFAKRYEGSWNFFWNITYDSEVILKLLNTNLFSYRETRKLSFKFGDYRIQYIPNKSLRIRKGHHSTVFFDIAQFFGRANLAKAHQDNIGQLPEGYLEFKSKRSGFSPRFYSRSKQKVRDYCIQDCKLTKALAEKWINLFQTAFGFYPQRWVSSGYLAEKVLINSGINFPQFAAIPYEVQELALRSYFGGRFEIVKRGFVGEGYLYDVNSAYPHAITKIPDLLNGKWVSRKSINSAAKIGFFKILADIPDCKRIPPFPFRCNGNIIFPSGKFVTYITLDELLACEKPEYYQILESWQFIPTSNHYPYQAFIERLYNKRLELKKSNNPLQLPIKIILNSIYGKTGQKVNRVMGNLFNPVIFSFITGVTRARLYRFVIDNNLENHVVSFATDSICTTRKLDVNSSKLGEFCFDNSASDVFYLQNGIYRFNGKWKQRGFGNLKGKEIEHIKTVERNGRLYYKLHVLRNTRLKSSIIQNTLEDIGKIRSVTREINLNADRKRLWLGRIESVDSEACNDSIPISLNHFTKNHI